ncbi:glutathione S-transferase family protein [Bradyrhizobium sp. B124]|uniref:glutathione S-transferase family protein n=1 Tax=Bradyrhizobium sp. B124 TaxID=3140245 RepID=UPI0031834FA4
MLTLYFAPGASSMAVHIALHEIGTGFEARPMSFKRNDMQAPDYLALNPEGKVPTLLIDGRPMTEVAAILFYLARRFPEAELLPRDDIEAEAQALSWMSFIASTLHPARARGLDYAKAVWGIADRRLGHGWAIGSYSIADIHLFRLYWRLANSLKLPLETFSNLTAHYEKMMARPAVQKTIEVESEVGYELPA